MNFIACSSDSPDTSPVKKRLLRPILFSAIAVLLAVCILVGALTNWFGFFGPATKLLLASGKTLFSESFTATLTLCVGSYQPDPIQIQARIDTDSKEITLAGRNADDAILRFAIYEGYLIYRTGLGKYTARDIRSDLEHFFDRTDAADWEELLKSISPSLYEQYGQSLNYNEIQPGLITLLRTLNNPQWLTDTAQMTVQRSATDTAYSFRPDAYAAATTALSCFEGIFKDSRDYTALMNGLTDSREWLAETQLSLQFVVSNGYLTQAEVSANQKDIPLSATIRFSQIGSTQIDSNELSDLLTRAATY